MAVSCAQQSTSQRVHMNNQLRSHRAGILGGPRKWTGRYTERVRMFVPTSVCRCSSVGSAAALAPQLARACHKLLPLAENDTAAHSLPRARRQSTSGARSGTAEHAARLAGARVALTERDRITDIPLVRHSVRRVLDRDVHGALE